MLLCDRDPKWSGGVEQWLATAGVRVVRAPPRAPNCAMRPPILRRVDIHSHERPVAIEPRFMVIAVESNPDDEDILRRHLHLYREGCGDRWAMPCQPGGLVTPAIPGAAVSVHAVRKRRRAAGHPTRPVHVIDEIRGGEAERL